MKVSKIPGMGRFGVYIDDVDFKNLTDEEWQEIGKIHLDSLVTIIRNHNLTPIEYFMQMRKWGLGRDLQEYRLTKKYNIVMSELLKLTNDDSELLEEKDKRQLKLVKKLIYWNDNSPTNLLKVTGKKDEHGDPLGMFAEGDLLWHSNESGNLCFAAGVALLGYEGMVGSATGFVTTVDWYEQQSESFRSELDDMVMIHKFTPGKINPGLRAEQDDLMYKNMCPVDGIEIPLVIRSPGGHLGLHYSVHTISHVKGMTVAESQKLFEKIDRDLFSDRFVYDHWYQTDRDLCLFDNSITLHRRLGGITNRMAYRFQYDYETLVDRPYVPYLQEPWITQYRNEITDIAQWLSLKRLKLPV